MGSFVLPRLYPILDLDALGERGLDPFALLDVWLSHGVRLCQLRAKGLATGPLLDLVDRATDRTHRVGGQLIVNDRADVARLAGADGVHVGQTDLSAKMVRELVGDTGVVGRSTHTSEQVRAACLEPVSYLAIGPVFETATKAGASDPAVGLEGVRDAVRQTGRFGLPVVAIGGITLDRAPDVLRAGAQSVAVIADLLRGDPGARLRLFTRTLDALTL